MSGYAAMFLILALMMAAKTPDKKREALRNLMRVMVRVEAREQGVPALLALATARVESHFDHDAIGDRNWHLNRSRFDRVVSRESPYYDQPELWRSYGVFQLLAPYHVEPGEDPRVLLDPPTNIARGVRRLKDLLSRCNGDWDAVRLAYKGIARDNPNAPRVLRRFHHAIDAERRIDAERTT